MTFNLLLENNTITLMSNVNVSQKLKQTHLAHIAKEFV